MTPDEGSSDLSSAPRLIRGDHSPSESVRAGMSMTSRTSTLQDLRVLIVEDETLVAMLLEDMLVDEGCKIAGVAPRLAASLDIIGKAPDSFDVAILDVNVAGEPVFPVAEALAAADKPFVFATGYGNAGLPATWRHRPTIQKPFGQAEVASAIAAAVGRQR